MNPPVCVIVGASHSAAQLGPSLRQEGWEGRILVIGDEAFLPYNRPPLSKTFLSGQKNLEQILIRHVEHYEKAGIEFRLQTRVTEIDSGQQSLTLDSGEKLEYSKLILCTGARVRKLEVPGAGLPGVHYLRSASDAMQIQADLPGCKNVVIVGGGYIGLETAAMLRQMGLTVTILEREERLLNRVTDAVVSDFYARIHQAAGVDLITHAEVSELAGSGRIERVKCSNGLEIPADMVIVGIGVIPNTELAEQAGLEVENGIKVNASCQTSDSNIYAAGDCAWFYQSHYQRWLRLESVQNAVDQARVIAASVCGRTIAYNALPWFWSDQYDLKLQIAGLSQDYDQVVVRGNPESGKKLAVFYFKENRMLAVDAVNSPQEFMFGKRIIQEDRQINRDQLANPTVTMKAVFDGADQGIN